MITIKQYIHKKHSDLFVDCKNTGYLLISVNIKPPSKTKKNVCQEESDIEVKIHELNAGIKCRL